MATEGLNQEVQEHVRDQDVESPMHSQGEVLRPNLHLKQHSKVGKIPK